MRVLCSRLAAQAAPATPRQSPWSSARRSDRGNAAAQAAPPEQGGGGGGSGGGSASADTVSIEFRGVQLQAERGTTLRTALLEAGVTPHNGRATLINCRGLGTCGTCAVEVQDPVEPAGWTAQERLRLNFPPHSPPGNARLRLACQVACQGDLRVIKRSRFWGQGKDVLPDLPSSVVGESAGAAAAAQAAAEARPLGELEFVLDRRRRRSRHE